MIIAGIIFFIVGIVMLTIALDPDMDFIGAFGIMFLGLGIGMFVNKVTEQATYKEALTNPRYKLEVQYQLTDSIYIPIDTVLVEIN